jgi:hypothetical protein
MNRIVFEVIDSSIVFGYDQQDFTEDVLILSSYDSIDFTPSDTQIDKNAKSIDARWIHYDSEEGKYIALTQTPELIDETT